MEFDKNKLGYHITNISKGKYGEISKIQEELDELIDADIQDCKIMILHELADLYGAIEGFLLTKFDGAFTMRDLEVMSFVTNRAFRNGHRESTTD